MKGKEKIMEEIKKFIKVDPSVVVVINAMGEIKFHGDIEDAYEFIFKTRPIRKFNAVQALLYYDVINDNYIVFHLGDIWRMFDKLKLIYVKLSEDKTKILGGYFSTRQAAKDSSADYLSKTAVRRSIKERKICTKDNCYYVDGEEAVSYLLKLGYLNKTLEFNNLNKDDEDYTHFPSTYVQKQKLKYQNLQDDKFVPITTKEVSDLPLSSDNLYGINKLGDVISYKTGNLLNYYINSNNYLIASISYRDSNNKIRNKKYPVHRLLASVFLNNPDPKRNTVVNHINDDNRLENLEWVSADENHGTLKTSPINEKYLGNYVGRDKITGEIVLSFNVKSIPNGYDYKKLRSITKIEANNDRRNREYKGLIWEYQKYVQIIDRYSGNLDDYTWLKHWKYDNVWVCKEGFVIVNNKISYSKDAGGYIFVSIKQKSYPAHRIIMEFLIKRDLDSSEYIDHINRNTSDNSFKNLRLTNAKGNSLNENTLSVKSNDIVVTSLSGEYLKRGYTREIYKFIYGEEQGDKRTSFLWSTIVNKKYICFKYGHLDDFYDKLKNVVLLVNKEKTKVLGAYKSIKDANNSGVVRKISELSAQKYTKTEKLASNGVYYLTGQTAVDTLKELGYLDEIIRMNTITIINQEKNL